MFKNILLSKEASVATLTINRPEVRNALDQDTRRELLVVLESLPADPSIRVLVITGAGDRAFAAGADIRGFVGTSTTEVVDRSYAMGSLGLFKKLAELDLPTIAAINGYALGGGCELAMCCDIRIAAENARLGQPEINIGIMPGAGGTQRLPRLIGAAKAKELCFTGDIIDAREAERLGLVNAVVPQAQLMEKTMEVARKIASKSPIALKYIKRSINLSWQTGLDAGLAFETYSFGACFATADKEEGVSAFLEKRTPEFKGK